VDALTGIRSNAIAACQKQTFADNPDTAIGVYCRFERGNSPRRARGNTPHDVEVHRSIGGNTSDGNDADCALELSYWLWFVVIIFVIELRESDTGKGQCDSPDQQAPDTGSSRYPTPKSCNAIAVHFILLELFVSKVSHTNSSDFLGYI
jgi:hypothetical protein